MEDFISRAEALKLAQEYPEDTGSGMSEQAVLVEDIERIPSAPVVLAVDAKWEGVLHPSRSATTQESEFPNESQCTHCGRRQLWMNARVYQFCPHCGAHMK